MKKIFILSSLIAVTLATPSFADPTELDKKTVASKAYVDTKQDIIETGLVEFDGEQLRPIVTTNASGIGVNGTDIAIIDSNVAGSSFGGLQFATDTQGLDLDVFIPTVGAVAEALRAFSWHPTTSPAAINAYSVTFDGTTGNWPSRGENSLVPAYTFVNSLALKQNKITTGLVEFDDYGTTAAVPALVSTNAAGTALNGNTIGFLDLNTYNNLNRAWDELPDTMVPSIGLLANELNSIWNNMASQWSPLSWNNTQSTAINAYNTTFGTGTNNWAGFPNHLINGQFLANSLALKQNKLPQQTTTTNYVPKGAQTITLATTADGAPGTRYITAGGSVGLTTKSDAPAVIGYVNGTVALAPFSSGTFGAAHLVADSRHIKNALVSLELLKDVYSELNSKITNNALPTGTTGTVVTYNGVNAETGVQEFGERAVYDPANAYNAQNDATKLATMASVKYECAGYEAGHENDPDYCWLWALPN